MFLRLNQRKTEVKNIALRIKAKRKRSVSSRVTTPFKATHRMITQSVKRKRRDPRQTVDREIRHLEVVEAARSIRLH